jgi:hypothetical protein
MFEMEEETQGAALRLRRWKASKYGTNEVSDWLVAQKLFGPGVYLFEIFLRIGQPVDQSAAWDACSESIVSARADQMILCASAGLGGETIYSNAPAASAFR